MKTQTGYPLQIGLDFDGVICDSGLLKQLGAKRLYGIDIPHEHTTGASIISRGILTREQYDRLQTEVYDSKAYLQEMKEVSEAFRFIRCLQREGHDVRIVTARYDDDRESNARTWLSLHDLSIPLSIVKGKCNKPAHCQGLDVYIDDEVSNLQNLEGIVPHRYLYSWDYNEHLIVPRGIERVSSWKAFYEKIGGIRQ